MVGIILGIILVVGIVWGASHFSKKRRAALTALAPSLGLNYGVDKLRADQPELAAASHFALFRSGHSRGFENLLSGNRDGISIRIVDFSYSSGYGNSRTTTQATVVLLSSENFNSPCTFDVYPEGIFSKIGAALGGQDVDLPTHPEFSRRFVLKGSDPEMVRQLINPATAGFFESHRGVTVSGNGNHLLFIRGYKYVKPPEIAGLLEDALTIFRLLAASSARLRGGA